MLNRSTTLRRFVAVAAAVAGALCAPATPARAQSGAPPVIVEYTQYWRFYRDNGPKGGLRYVSEFRVEDADSETVKRRLRILGKDGEVLYDWNYDEFPTDGGASDWRLELGVGFGMSLHNALKSDLVDSTVVMTAVDAEGNEAAPVVLKSGPPPTEPGDPVVTGMAIDLTGPKVVVSGVGFTKACQVVINDVVVAPSAVELGRLGNRKTFTIEGDLSAYRVGLVPVNRVEVIKGERRSNSQYLKY